jgi:DNA-binding SARP family transcriptional activator
LECRILGPFELWSDRGEQLNGPPRKERELLAVLLLYAGRPCSRGLLASALWGEAPPSDPEAALRVCVCRARKIAGVAGWLSVLPGAYRADVGTDGLDLLRFRALLALAGRQRGLGDLRRAEASLRSALGCWRDPPLASLPPTAEIAAEAEGLLEQRRQAELDLADVMLDLGEHQQILAHLHARAVADHLCERRWQQLMLALYRCGRRSEALAAYSRARASLVEEFGAGPGQELQALLGQILAGTAPRGSGRRGAGRSAALAATLLPALRSAGQCRRRSRVTGSRAAPARWPRRRRAGGAGRQARDPASSRDPGAVRHVRPGRPPGPRRAGRCGAAPASIAPTRARAAAPWQRWHAAR